MDSNLGKTIFREYRPFPTAPLITKEMQDDINLYANKYHGNIRLALGHVMTAEEELDLIRKGNQLISELKINKL